MRTVALYKCLDLFIQWRDDDEQVRKLFEEVKHPDLQNIYEIPFTRELGENLINKPTPQEKSDLIVFYICLLARNARIHIEYKKIDLTDLWDGYPVRYQYVGWDLRRSDLADVRAHYFYSRLFNEIQTYCNVFHIPFRQICKDRFFDLSTINLEPTLINELGKSFFAENEVTEKKSLPAIRPIFSSSLVPQIFDMLKDFFAPDQQEEFLDLLKTGGDAKEHLLFLDSGIRLADAFKQLFDSNVIKGCQKKELEKWIKNNFHFRYRDNVKEFTIRYLSDVISTDSDRCKNPIFNVIREKVTGNCLLTKL